MCFASNQKGSSVFLWVSKEGSVSRRFLTVVNRGILLLFNKLFVFFLDKGANWDLRSQNTVVPLTAMLTPQVEGMPALTNISLLSHAHQSTGKGERERAIDRKRKSNPNNSFPFLLYRCPTS